MKHSKYYIVAHHDDGSESEYYGKQPYNRDETIAEAAFRFEEWSDCTKVEVYRETQTLFGERSTRIYSQQVPW